MPRVIDIYSCGGFNRGLKKLQKHRKQSLLLKLNRIIDELRDFEVGNKYHNHKLSGSDYFELHVGGDILLVYKYVDSESGLKLELFNLTDHDRLNQSIRGDDRLNIKKRKVYSSIYKDYTDYFRVEYRGNGYAIHSTPVDNRPEADSRKLFEDFRATVGVSNPYDDADYYWARIQDGIIEFIKDGKVDRDETEFYYDADDMDEENSDWCGVIIDIAVQKLDRLNKDIKPRIIHNSVTVKYKSAVKGSNYGEKYGSADPDYVGYNYLGDYITENYEGDLDDRYGCIDSLRESFKNEEKVAKDIIREFAYAHNLDDIHAEPEAVKGAGTIKTIKELERKLYDRAKKEMVSFGFPSLEVGDYLFVETRPVDFDDGTSGYRVEVRAELGYDDMYDLVSALDPVIVEYDENAYFDMDEPGIASAYVSDRPFDLAKAEQSIFGATALAFVELPIFTKVWQALGLLDEELRRLQSLLISNPYQGKVIEGSGGARKVRISVENGQGKSNGARVIYVDFLSSDRIYLIAVYPKSKKSNLSNSEISDIRKLIGGLD